MAYTVTLLLHLYLNFWIYILCSPSLSNPCVRCLINFMGLNYMMISYLLALRHSLPGVVCLWTFVTFDSNTQKTHQHVWLSQLNQIIGLLNLPTVAILSGLMFSAIVLVCGIACNDRCLDHRPSRLHDSYFVQTLLLKKD